MAIGKPNIADVLKGYLESEVKRQLSDEITDKLVQEYKCKVREIVDSELDNITFDKIEHVKHMLDLTEDLNIQIRHET